MIPQPLPEIPESLVERFAAVFAAFLAEVKLAIDDALRLPETEAFKKAQAWLRTPLPVLEKQNAAIQSAVTYFQIGDVGPILKCAESERGLAKDLDGFPLDFAGPEHEQKLDLLLTNVVTVAYQLCAAARIP